MTWLSPPPSIFQLPGEGKTAGAAKSVGKEDEEGLTEFPGAAAWRTGTGDRLGPSLPFWELQCLSWGGILSYTEPPRVCPSPGSLSPADSGQQRSSNKRFSLFQTFFSFLPLSVPILEEISPNPHPLPFLAPKLPFPPCFASQIPFPPVCPPQPHPSGFAPKPPTSHKPPPAVLPPKTLVVPHFPPLSPRFPVTQCHVRASCSGQ